MDDRHWGTRRMGKSVYIANDDTISWKIPAWLGNVNILVTMEYIFRVGANLEDGRDLSRELFNNVGQAETKQEKDKFFDMAVRILENVDIEKYVEGQSEMSVDDGREYLQSHLAQLDANRAKLWFIPKSAVKR